MALTNELTPGPPSPWRGSEHRTRHRWQLERVTTLAEVASQLRELAAELATAHAAGWELVEPMDGGHLLASRPSRRRRGRQPVVPTVAEDAPPPLPPWRLRLIDEPPAEGDLVFRAATSPRTPILEHGGPSLRQVAGPPVDPQVHLRVAEQVDDVSLGTRAWGLTAARVGPSFDLVADGSALRMHQVVEGRLVRTHETLTFQHAADRARTLPEAAAAYLRLARAADVMAAAGGRLAAADDGLLHVRYTDG